MCFRFLDRSANRVWSGEPKIPVSFVYAFGNPQKCYYCYSAYDFHFLHVQAEFGDLNLASYSDSGTMVDIQVYREGTVVVR